MEQQTMWTAVDYIGEVGLGAWSYDADGIGFQKPYPWLLADTGAMDILLEPNGELYQAKAAWGLLKEPVICVSPDVCHPNVVAARCSWRGTNSIPSWSFTGCQGNQTTVEVYACGTEAALYLNEQLIGRKKL